MSRYFLHNLKNNFMPDLIPGIVSYTIPGNVFSTHVTIPSKAIKPNSGQRERLFLLPVAKNRPSRIYSHHAKEIVSSHRGHQSLCPCHLTRGSLPALRIKRDNREEYGLPGKMDDPRKTKERAGEIE